MDIICLHLVYQAIQEISLCIPRAPAISAPHGSLEDRANLSCAAGDKIDEDFLSGGQKTCHEALDNLIPTKAKSRLAESLALLAARGSNNIEGFQEIWKPFLGCWKPLHLPRNVRIV